jgi:hypothetical protein
LQSGFYKKSATHGFTQCITVHNTKSVPVDGLCIIDQIPVSRNAQVKVNLAQPALLLGEGKAAGKGAAGAEPDAGAGVKWVAASRSGEQERGGRASGEQERRASRSTAGQ